MPFFKPLAALLLCIALPAFGADIRPSGHPRCDFKLEGEINRGDAAQLDQVGGTYDGKTLCLNSPGGSLGEGKRMFDIIWADNIKTRVLAGERCESACALAFLGGSINTGSANIRFQYRALEAGAKLGFHAPKLELPDDRAYSSEVVGKAFETALKSAEDIHKIRLHEEHSVGAMNVFLYQRILSTRPESMYYLNTIGDAAVAGVKVEGLTIPPNLSEREIANLCDNTWVIAMADLDPEYDQAADYYDEIGNGFYDKRKVTLRRDGSHLVGQVSDYYSAVKFGAFGCEVRIREDDYRRSRLGTEQKIFVLFYSYFGDDEFGNHIKDARAPLDFNVPLWYTLDPSTSLAGKAASRANAAPASANDFVAFRGYDLFGGDLADGVVRGIKGSQACIGRCINTANCDAATHDRWNKICYLKSVARSDKKLYVLSKATTFVKAPKDGDMRRPRKGVIKTWTRKDKGFRDRPYDTRIVESQRACERTCSLRECHAFNWRPSTRECELFSEPGEYFDAKGVVAGFKQQERVE